MREHEINKLDNFINGWYIDQSCCDKLIEMHKTSDKVVDGALGSGVYKTVKDSKDLCLSHHEYIKTGWTDQLQKCVNEYIKKYPWCNEYYPWGIKEKVNIQYYPPGGGFYEWHTERPNNIEPISRRHLVFMTYLNDVTDGGETEFYHQKLKIKPEKGLTLIWPTDWTFTHRGITSITQEKYIITGWFAY